MSTTDGDAASRLDSALADVFADTPTLPAREVDTRPSRPDSAPAAATGDDWAVDDPDDDAPVGVPEIVPATADPVPPPAPSAVATPQAASTVPTTSWGDHMTNAPVNAPPASLRAPGRRPRVRRVTRVLRHIDPWSTFKVALLFSAVAYLVTLTAGVLLWRVADSTGTLDNIERWFTQFGWETFELKGDEIFHNAWIIGLFAAVALTGALVLLATLFNLVSDIVGGVRMTVLEEEVVERTVSSTRRYVVRRAPAAESAEADDWAVDDDDDGDETATREESVDSASDDPEPPRESPTDDWSVDDD